MILLIKPSPMINTLNRTDQKQFGIKKNSFAQESFTSKENRHKNYFLIKAYPKTN